MPPKLGQLREEWQSTEYTGRLGATWQLQGLLITFQPQIEISQWWTCIGLPEGASAGEATGAAAGNQGTGEAVGEAADDRAGGGATGAAAGSQGTGEAVGEAADDRAGGGATGAAASSHGTGVGEAADDRAGGATRATPRPQPKPQPQLELTGLPGQGTCSATQTGLPSSQFLRHVHSCAAQI